MEAADIMENEKVQVVDNNNGNSLKLMSLKEKEAAE